MSDDDAKVLGLKFTDDEHKALAARLAEAMGVALGRETDVALAETGDASIAAPIIVTAIAFAMKSFIETVVSDHAVRAALWQQYALNATANRDAEIRCASLLTPSRH